MSCISHLLFFFFNDTATTEIYTLSLHDALPIFSHPSGGPRPLRLSGSAQRARIARRYLGVCPHFLDSRAIRPPLPEDRRSLGSRGLSGLHRQYLRPPGTWSGRF